MKIIVGKYQQRSSAPNAQGGAIGESQISEIPQVRAVKLAFFRQLIGFKDFYPGSLNLHVQRSEFDSLERPKSQSAIESASLYSSDAFEKCGQLRSNFSRREEYWYFCSSVHLDGYKDPVQCLLRRPKKSHMDGSPLPFRVVELFFEERLNPSSMPKPGQSLEVYVD